MKSSEQRFLPGTAPRSDAPTLGHHVAPPQCHHVAPPPPTAGRPGADVCGLKGKGDAEWVGGGRVVGDCTSPGDGALFRWFSHDSGHHEGSGRTTAVAGTFRVLFFVGTDGWQKVEEPTGGTDSPKVSAWPLDMRGPRDTPFLKMGCLFAVPNVWMTGKGCRMEKWPVLLPCDACPWRERLFKRRTFAGFFVRANITLFTKATPTGKATPTAPKDAAAGMATKEAEDKAPTVEASGTFFSCLFFC